MENDEEYKKMLNFFYEVGMLKRLPRAGSFLAMVDNPETIAAHSLRSTFIGFILAKLENANPKESALICAFHELGETRIGDTNKVHARYYDKKGEAEKKAVQDQLSLLPKDIAEDLGFYVLNEGTDNSKEQIIAKDADYIEAAVQAKEYIEQGYSHMWYWINYCKKCVKTKSAKKFIELIEKSNSQDWYSNICKIQRLD